MIKPQQRMAWDILIFVVIIGCAFEIPYGIFVGYSSLAAELGYPALAVEQFFDIVFFALFGLDMVLNCFSVRTESFGGLWGWRVLAGVVSKRLSPRSEQLRVGRPPRLLDTQPGVFCSYAKSGWFLIDAVATIPWSWFLPAASFLTMSRTVRLLRITRLLRLVRLTKGLKALNAIRHAASALPSLGRLLMTMILLPWLGHVLACILYAAEQGNPASSVTDYGEALYLVFMMFATGEFGQDQLTSLGYGVVVSGTVLSLLFIGSAFANLAVLFMGLDSRRGKRIQEARSEHTLVLGWSSAIFSVLEQLMTDDEGKGTAVVLLADRDVDAMWHHIAENCVGIKPDSVAIYRGAFDSAGLLEELSIATARNVIILSEDPTESASTKVHGLADVRLLKSILACAQAIDNTHQNLARSVYGAEAARHEFRRDYKVPIIAAVNSASTADILNHGVPAALAEHIDLRVVDAVNTTCRVLAQVVVQPALADVYLDLLSYEAHEDDEGAEIYCIPVTDEQANFSFERLRNGFPEAIAIGWIRDGTITLNPPIEADEPLAVEDTMVLIASSREATHWSDGGAPDPPDSAIHPPEELPARDVLLLGVGARAREIAAQLLKFLPAGSHLRAFEPSMAATDDRCRVSCIGQTDYTPGDDESLLTDLLDQGLEALETGIDTVVLIPTARDPLVHDAEIFMALTALQARWRHHQVRPTVVVELFDPANVSTVALYDAPVTVVSTALLANYLVQLSQEPLRGNVFHALIDDPEGAELYARDASSYFGEDDEASFATLSARARARGEVAIGLAGPEIGTQLCPPDREQPHGRNVISHLIVVADE
jgi:hypothetical protein